MLNSINSTLLAGEYQIFCLADLDFLYNTLNSYLIKPLIKLKNFFIFQLDSNISNRGLALLRGGYDLNFVFIYYKILPS